VIERCIIGITVQAAVHYLAWELGSQSWTAHCWIRLYCKK